MKRIDDIKFIEDGKWDWEHGLGHSKRVAKYIERILTQLNVNERIVDLGITAALLHDIGLVKGNKKVHAIESSKNFYSFIENTDITEEEKNEMSQAILDHSNGKDIKSLIGLALVLADKLYVTYHRTINSSVQDEVNKEIQKIKKVDIKITKNTLVVSYHTINDFNSKTLTEWNKAVDIPKKVKRMHIYN